MLGGGQDGPDTIVIDLKFIKIIFQFFFLLNIEGMSVYIYIKIDVVTETLNLQLYLTSCFFLHF